MTLNVFYLNKWFFWWEGEHPKMIFIQKNLLNWYKPWMNPNDPSKPITYKTQPTSPTYSPHTALSSAFGKEMSLISEVSVISSRNAFIIAWFLWKISQQRHWTETRQASSQPHHNCKWTWETISDASTHFLLSFVLSLIRMTFNCVLSMRSSPRKWSLIEMEVDKCCFLS